MLLLTIRRTKTSAPAAKGNSASRLEPLTVKAEYLQVLLDHALDHNGLVVFAPGRALAPMADLSLTDLGKLGAIDRIDLQQTKVIERRVRFCAVGAIRNGHCQIGAVASHGDTFRCLTDAHGIDHARRIGFQVDNANGVSFPLSAALVANHGNVAPRANFDAVWAIAADHEFLAIGDGVAIHRQD